MARALESAGMQLVTGPAVARESRLVTFDVVSAELCDQLHALGGGSERVLAIAISPATLDVDDCWRLLEAGASDVLAWNRLQDPAADIAARLRRWETIDGLADSALVQESLVGRSTAWRQAVRRIVEVASFTDASVLITGESGTGKELAARLIHTLDPRPDKGDLVILDCTTVVPTLSGSEFFGHEKGAFTGAVTARDGAFQLADGGTLFLDEIGELPLGLQAELLRVIQEGMYKRVGSNAWRRTSFRLLCATNRDLLGEELRGRFRKDLYYRIATWTCRLPSLRERTDDIPLLVRHFLGQMLPVGTSTALDDAIGELLRRRVYPGNVRDLRQLVARICSRHAGCGPITAGDVPEDERPSPSPSAPDWRREGFEAAIRIALAQGAHLVQIGKAAAETAIRLALAEENGNLQRAARRLGITDRALQMRVAARRVNGNGHGPSA